MALMARATLCSLSRAYCLQTGGSILCLPTLHKWECLVDFFRHLSLWSSLYGICVGDFKAGIKMGQDRGRDSFIEMGGNGVKVGNFW